MLSKTSGASIALGLVIYALANAPLRRRDPGGRDAIVGGTERSVHRHRGPSADSALGRRRRPPHEAPYGPSSSAQTPALSESGGNRRLVFRIRSARAGPDSWVHVMMNILKRSFLFLSPAVQSPRIPSPSFTQSSGHYFEVRHQLVADKRHEAVGASSSPGPVRTSVSPWRRFVMSLICNRNPHGD